MLSTIPSTETTYKSINLFSKQLNWDKIKGLYKIFACDKFDLFLIVPKPLIFAPTTLHVLFIWILKFNLLLMVNPTNFTDLDDSIVLLFFFYNWYIDCIFTENHELKLSWISHYLITLKRFSCYLQIRFKILCNIIYWFDQAAYGVLIKIANVSFFNEA